MPFFPPACGRGHEAGPLLTHGHEGLRYSSAARDRLRRRGQGAEAEEMQHVEALWALAWSLGIGPELDFGDYCPDELVTFFPDIKRAESADDFRSRARLRPAGEVAQACDAAYCLHWGIREADRRRRRAPGKVWPYVIVERRWALEWLMGSDDWDEVSLDT